MDRMLYVAMNGAQQAMRAQTVTSNNLANVNTTAFRADFASFISEPVRGPGYESRVYGVVNGSGTDFTHGSPLSTGNELDVAVAGKGWIAVQGADGREAYTRAGDLRVTETGMLETGAGHPVLGNGGPITVPPFQKIEIGADGTISIVPIGQSASTQVVVDRIKLVNPPASEFEKGEDGLMRARGGADAVADAGVRVRSGMIETSNVNAVESMIDLMALSRSFEVQVRLMRAAQENDASSAQLLRIR